MNNIVGLSNRVLEIELSDKSFTIYNVPEEYTKLYLGGKGLALKMMFDRFKAGTDSLGPDNLLVIHTGAFMGTGAPCSGRFSAVSKSPLTGIITSSSCGGPFGMALKTSGWDGLILKGLSDNPVWLDINSKGVKFHDAEDLWGKNTSGTQEAIDGFGSGSMVIGQAGENLVNYACIVSGNRFFGRTGLGAVMGSKKVKAISALGKEYKIDTAHPEKFRKIRKAFIKDINNNKYSSVEYRKYGTASNVIPANKHMMLPVNNFRDGTHPDYMKVSGEEIEKNHTEAYDTCKPCSILCGHKGDFNGRKLQVPEYETIGLLGTSIGIFDPVKIAEWNETCKQLGIDTISAGGTLAWAMEAGENGIYETELTFGNPENIDSTLIDIALGRGKGIELGKGSRWLSEKYGGKDYAIQSKGLEAAAYDPRGSFGHGLALATANRGACHLSASIMSLQAFYGFSYKFMTLGSPYLVVYFEDFYAAINSLITCQFTAYAVVGERAMAKYIPRSIIRIFMALTPQLALQILLHQHYYQLLSAIVGRKYKQYNFRRSGKRIHLLERYMNCLEGITKKDDTLPDRFTQDVLASDRKGHKVKLKWMLKKYYIYRGYDRDGIPKPSTLRRWGITIKD